MVQPSVPSVPTGPTGPSGPSVSYDGYAFTLDEMRRVVVQQRLEALRVETLGPAALEDLSDSALLDFDMGRVLAIIDYYNIVHLPSIALAGGAAAALA
jgi:hypothetical protein